MRKHLQSPKTSKCFCCDCTRGAISTCRASVERGNRYRLVELSTSKSCRTGEIPRGARSPAGTLQLSESHGWNFPTISGVTMSIESVSRGISGLQGEMEGGAVPQEGERRKEEKKRKKRRKKAGGHFFSLCTAEGGLAGSDAARE